MRSSAAPGASLAVRSPVEQYVRTGRRAERRERRDCARPAPPAGSSRPGVAEVALVSLNAVRKSFGSRVVLDGLDFAVEPRARVGVVGANGSGKSTMLKLIAGLEEPDAGTSVRRRGIVVSFLPQHPLGRRANAARDRARGPPRPRRAGSRPSPCRRAAGRARPCGRPRQDDARPPPPGGARRTWWRQPAARASTAERAPPCSTSGSRRTTSRCRRARSPAVQRKLIAPQPASRRIRTCSCSTNPRPTSTRSAARSSSACCRFDGAAVAVSHDRYLLDETVSQIAELHRGRIRTWPGNYSAYTLARELELQRQQQQFVTQQKEIERPEAAVRRFKDWAHRVVDERHIKQARNKQRQIDRMEKVDRPVLERRKIGLRLHPHERGGQRVFELRHLGMQFGDDVVLHDVELTVVHGERVGFVGANGAGKSVLLKTVVGELEPSEARSGSAPRSGSATRPGQETLDPESSPLETVRLAHRCAEGEAVSLLMKFLFPYEQVRRPNKLLSGGERTRLQLLLLMLQRPNLLVLDEPTTISTSIRSRFLKRRWRSSRNRLRDLRTTATRPDRRPDRRGRRRRRPLVRGRLDGLVERSRTRPPTLPSNSLLLGRNVR